VPPEGQGFVLWAQRQEDRPRRRHEISFHMQQPEGPSLNFVSRPGVFSYGRFDQGARALVETMLIEPGNKMLDVGCGCGTIGIPAGLRAGPEGKVVFVDSNLRALALTELNARANGLTNYRTVAGSKIDNIDEDHFDVALANPPYFAQNSIARLFIERCRKLLKPGGRFYLVTKNDAAIAEIITEFFAEAEAVVNRGYTIFQATAK
jgi:16S rRNA (guanine1207-N2)-methyltransferase